ncbi:hypothetical protein G8C92_04835 [Paenibacillus donghaensis]|uniref:tail fiber protein n=2 Tax=Paenibacillus TaxID=44249 RepID=UPI0018837B1E|nr:tail fiber protein [Paenibacillus donghaensis]MBE9913369.1 hypothetical protein [Paenibacillus donghaensis]
MARTDWTLKDTVKPSDLNDIGNEINSLKGPDYSKWTLRTSAADNVWHSVCYGNGMFVAVASGTGTGNRVMTSLDGINWTTQKSAADNQWRSVCYGNGMFVAVSESGTGNRVMTSPDGINWTTRQSAADSNWFSVCYGNGLFVAVSSGGRVMTSPDGINWTERKSAANQWHSVCYGNGMFVAVAYGTGTDNKVMTSPDGVSWTECNGTSSGDWYSVCYGNGLFVAVAYTGTGGRVMTSPDGINWTARNGTMGGAWQSVCYGNGIFVAVGYSTRSIMTSPDGINWIAQKSADSNLWYSVCYGNGMFVAVSGSGTGNRVMTSGSVGAAVRASNVFIDSKAVAEKDIQSAIESLNAKTSSLSDIVDKIHIPSASLTEPGIVQLSNATDGTRENVAATEKAIKDAGLWAKSYTDQQIGLVTETGIPKLVSYPLKVTATADNQKVFEIPLDLFDANTDTLLISINRAVLDSTQYTVTNTVRNEDGKVTQRAKITLLSGVTATSEVTMVVLKNVPIGPDGAINGAVLAVDSVPINRVSGLQDQLDLVFQSVSDGKNAVAAAITDKGVPASGSETFPQLGSKIKQISTGALYWADKVYSNEPLRSSYVRKELYEIPASKSKVFIASLEDSNCSQMYDFTIYATTWTNLTTEQNYRIEVSLLLIDNKGQAVSLLSGKYEGIGVQPRTHTMIAVLLIDRTNGTVTFRGGTGGGLEIKTVTLPSNFNATGPVKLVAEHSKNYSTTEDATWMIGGIKKAFIPVF